MDLWRNSICGFTGIFGGIKKPVGKGAGHKQKEGKWKQEMDVKEISCFLCRFLVQKHICGTKLLDHTIRKEKCEYRKRERER